MRTDDADIERTHRRRPRSRQAPAAGAACWWPASRWRPSSWRVDGGRAGGSVPVRRSRSPLCTAILYMAKEYLYMSQAKTAVNAILLMTRDAWFCILIHRTYKYEGPPAVSHSSARRARAGAQPGAAAAAALAAGFDVTQATLSRDIKELGLVKRSSDGAYQAAGADTHRRRRGRSLFRARSASITSAWSRPATRRPEDGAGTGAAARTGDRSRAPAGSGRHDRRRRHDLVICRDARQAQAARHTLERLAAEA